MNGNSHNANDVTAASNMNGNVTAATNSDIVDNEKGREKFHTYYSIVLTHFHTMKIGTYLIR